MLLRFLTIALLLVLAPVSTCLADALMVTRAMKASTIAEISVESDEIRVELEVGTEDFEAFANLLPDKVYEKLAGKAIPVADRLKIFVNDDWQMIADEQKLNAVIDEVEFAKRVIRDEITGEPLPVQPDSVEFVLRVRWHYPLEDKPDLLTIRPPGSDTGFASANVGFVVYHRGIAVNDFRYLSQQERLRLDWNDPWYSAFERKNLRRQYYAPAAAFIYVENFEVRKEIVFRPKDLQHWIDLGLQDQSVIKADQREALCQQAAEFLDEHSPLKIDGEQPTGLLDRVHFISRSLKTTAPQRLSGV